MSISNITATGSLSQIWQSLAQQRQQDFNNLSQALQAGDLAGAQKAYASLQGVQPNSTTGTSTSSTSNPVQNDFAALGEALASGNLSQAQGAFSQLQSDLTNGTQNAAGTQQTSGTHKGHHHHHHGGASTQDSSSTTDSTTTTNGTSGSGTGVNVTA